MCTTLTNTLSAVADIARAIDNTQTKIATYQKNKIESEYKQQIALKNARILEEQAQYQNQLGIENSRQEKIEGISKANYQKVLASASNFDVNSKTNLQNFEDVINLSDLNSEKIKTQYERTSEQYFDKANDYRNSAKIEQEKNKNNLFKFAMTGLGESTKISKKWLK